MQKPLLSIGIIFKNEIRCLERCLRSLEPLRQAIPCELVMADTGSDDGSREIAEKYAQILIDFPWINDFAAARNAVMDRCAGTWFLTLDADEWLDPDIEELLAFLQKPHEYNYFRLTIRNYKSENLGADGLYLDSSATRLVRMSTGSRFRKPIHEHLETNGEPVVLLRKTILHHDGYVHTLVGGREAKEKRNLEILRDELEKDPDDLMLLLQCYESSYDFPEDHMGYLRRGMELTEERRDNWRTCGPALFRHGVSAAISGDLPEVDQWIGRAEELFPDSIITRVDVNYNALCLCWNRGDYSGCIRRAEAYFQAVRDYEAGDFDPQDMAVSPLSFAAQEWQQTARSFLAASWLYQKQPKRCAEVLETLLGQLLNEYQTAEAVRTLVRLHALSEEDTVPLVLALWERVNDPVPSQDAAEMRLEQLNSLGFGLFRPDFALEEGPVLRPACQVFLPLEQMCDLGRAAALYAAGDMSEIKEKLAAIPSLKKIPVWILAHALCRGVPFPDRLLKLEELDELAQRLAQQSPGLELELALAPAGEGLQDMTWARALALAAVRAYDWSAEDVDAEKGLELARVFAQVERKFLHQFYTPALLCEENICLLPALHRFGWYCAQAFDALENGDAVGYVHLLREGLALCEGMKDMVNFLVEHTEEVQAVMAPPELVELANQVRAVLARYDPNDPAVKALKQSVAYQKVAYLIERPEPGTFGGHTQ